VFGSVLTLKPCVISLHRRPIEIDRRVVSIGRPAGVCFRLGRIYDIWKRGPHGLCVLLLINLAGLDRAVGFDSLNDLESFPARCLVSAR